MYAVSFHNITNAVFIAGNKEREKGLVVVQQIASINPLVATVSRL